MSTWPTIPPLSAHQAEETVLGADSIITHLLVDISTVRGTTTGPQVRQLKADSRHLRRPADPGSWFYLGRGWTHPAEAWLAAARAEERRNGILVAWDYGAPTRSCAWGSWRSPTAPHLRYG
jgi:hypothetical protein